MKDKLKAIIAGVLNIDAAVIDENSSNQTIENWDSLNHMNIILSVEEQFEITFDDEEMLGLTSFKKLLEGIEKYKNSEMI